MTPIVLAAWLAAALGAGAAGASIPVPEGPATVRESPLAGPRPLPAPAAVHQRLLRSDPAAGATVEGPLAEARLEFAEAVQLPFTQITLIGPAGEVDLPAPLRLADGAPNVLIITIPPLAPGEYTLGWRTASADGHPVTGTIAFSVTGVVPVEHGQHGAVGAGEGVEPDPGEAGVEGAGAEGEAAAGTAAGAAATAGGSPGASTAAARAFGVGSPLYIVARWGTFAGTLGVLGAAAFYWLVAGTVRRRRAAPAEVVRAAAGRAARIGVAAAACLLVFAVARLAAQIYALAGEFAVEMVGSVLFQTTWGWGWRLQFAAAAIAGIGFLLAVRSAAGWGVALLAALLAAVAPALSGHAVASGHATFAVAADALHVLGAGGWIGGLVFLLAAGLPAALRHGGEGRGRDAAAFVNAFSSTALVFASLTVLTGCASMTLQIGSPAELWTTTYGCVLLAKLAALALLFALGAYNSRRVRPAVAEGDGARRLRATGALELAAAVVVILVTAVLVGTTPPAAERAADPPAVTLDRADL